MTGSGAVSVPTYVSNIQYRASGAVKSETYGNGRQLTQQFDNRLRLTQWNVAGGGTGVNGYTYRYDNFGENGGRVTYAQNLYDPTLHRSFQYDHVGRLYASHTGEQARVAIGELQGPGAPNGPYAHEYYYDVWGNITSRGGWGGWNTPSAYTFTNNRLDAFQHDAAGNPVSDGGVWQWQYDATGQQTFASINQTQQGYDGDRLRVKRVESGTTTYYVRSSMLGGGVVAEINSSGGWARGYIYRDGGGLVAIQQEGQVEWVHADPVAKSQRMTNTAGGVTAVSIEVDPWGGETDRMSDPTRRQPRRYTTYTRDLTGEDEAMHRRYNGWHARFYQPDPYDGSYDLTAPQSLNRYAYVQNDPVNFTDPTGLDPQEDDPPPGGWPTDPRDYDYIYIDVRDRERLASFEWWWQQMLTPRRRMLTVAMADDFTNRRVGRSVVLRPDVSDRDTFAVNSALGLCGVGANIGEYSIVPPRGFSPHAEGSWRGYNGQYNRMGWQGNGSTGGRSVAVGRANGLRMLGRAAGGVGIGFSAYQLGDSARRGEGGEAAKAGLDIGMGVVGLAGGVPGAVVGGIYFGVDMTVGWSAVGNSLARQPGENDCARRMLINRLGPPR